MSQARRRISLIVTAITLNSSLISMPALAHNGQMSHVSPPKDKLTTHLDPFRDDTSALLNINLDIKTWSEALDAILSEAQANVTVEKTETTEGESEAEAETVEKTSGNDFMAMFNEANNELKKEAGIDLFWDVLLNLGTHMSMGYRPYPGRAGDLLFNLNLKSGHKAADVLSKLFKQVQKSDIEMPMQRYAFGPSTIYSIELDAKEENYPRIYVSVTGDQMIATAGPDDHQLKTMLYLNQVHDAKSKFKLNNMPVFKPVRQALQEQPIWFYTDLQSLVKLGKEFIGDEISENEMAIVEALVPMYRGIGAGFKLGKESIQVKTFLAPDQAQLSDYQKTYYQALLADSQVRAKLVDQIPGKATLIMGGTNLLTSLRYPFPVSERLLENSEFFKDFKKENYELAVQKAFNLSMQSDILPYLDGQYGLGVVEIEGQKEPQTVMVMGLNPDKSADFEQKMSQSFQVDMKALLEEDDAPTIKLVAAEAYKGTKTYRFSGLEEVRQELGEWLDPVAARYQNMWVIAQTPAALQALIDKQALEAPGLSKWMRKTDSQQSANVMYLNMSRVWGWLARLSENDTDIQELAENMKAWKGIYATSQVKPDGLEGLMVIDIDYKDKSLREGLLKAFMEGFNEGLSGDEEAIEADSEEVSSEDDVDIDVDVEPETVTEDDSEEENSDDSEE